MVFRAATVCDYPTILKLNEELVHFLSPMDENLLVKLHEQSELIQVIEENEQVVAFIILMREGKDYESENYRWFCQHYPHFLYVDRIVVDVAYHHRGYGEMLYNQVFSQAKDTDAPIVAAEVNIQPPNPVSLSFHKKSGFEEVGTQWLSDGKKQVSLLVAQVK